MKISHLVFLFGLSIFPGFISGQDCAPVSVYNIQACIQQPTQHKASLRSTRHADVNSLEQIFYAYFEGTDYLSYKDLFLRGEWYGLPESEFNTWRAFIQNADLNIIGTVEANVSGKALGVIKYTYIIDDLLLYETFLAKKIGTKWYPVSTQEERALLGLSRMVKFINLDYLNYLTFNSGGAQNNSNNTKSIVPLDAMLANKDSLRAFSPSEFIAQFNPEYVYRTNAKYKEDRRNDTKFTPFLVEMNLTPDQVDIVMKYIVVQDYLTAARKADDFSPVTYTYAPFVDKIREVYGSDRLKKWNQVTQNWE